MYYMPESYFANLNKEKSELLAPILNVPVPTSEVQNTWNSVASSKLETFVESVSTIRRSTEALKVQQLVIKQENS